MREEQTRDCEVSFIVPCHNEASHIQGTIEQIDLAICEVGVHSYEIIVVDDCSSDATLAVARQLAARRPHINVLSNDKKAGLGGAYKAGLSAATGRYVMMVPGDNSHPHEGISPILHKAGKADIIVPFASNPEARPLFRRAISRAFTVCLNVLFQVRLPYFNGLVLHRTNLLQTIHIHTNSFAYQAEALIRLAYRGASYLPVSVVISERASGRTSAFQPKNLLQVTRAISSMWLEFCLRNPALTLAEERSDMSGT